MATDSSGEATSDGAWAHYSRVLELLARLLVCQASRARPWLRSKLSASDLVQESLLAAHQGEAACRAATSAGRQAWLRGILRHVFLQKLRSLGRQQRDGRRDRSLEARLDASSLRLEGWLEAGCSSPAEQAERNEQLARLAQALSLLPERQRQAVELHHLGGWSLEETARELGCSAGAVAGLLHRGLVSLREVLVEGNPG